MKLDLRKSALLIIDAQNDFCPGGALAIKDGDEVIAPLNRLAAFFTANGGRVVATQDWHPSGHVSFASSHENKKPGDAILLPAEELPLGGRPAKGEHLRQELWPCHCVAGTPGADFHPSLDLKPVQLVVRKGFRPQLDSYSAFFENDRLTSTGLDGFLKSLSVDTLVLGGLATDYCVLHSALDAASLGYKTIVAEDAVRGVGIPEGSVERAFALLREKGVHITESAGILASEILSGDAT